MMQPNYTARHVLLADTQYSMQAAGKKFNGEDVVAGLVNTFSDAIAHDEYVLLCFYEAGAVVDAQPVCRAEVYPDSGGIAGEHFHGEGVAFETGGSGSGTGFGKEFNERL